MNIHPSQELGSAPKAPERMMPRAVVEPARVSYRLLTPRDRAPGHARDLAEAYSCWSTVWYDTLHELDGVLSVPSDEFTRQTEIGALFHDRECMGLTMYRWVDLASPIDQDDSYFKVWPEAALSAVMGHGPRVCIVSNLTVPAAWRRAANVSIKGVLLALAIERFLRSDADVLIAATRNNRGMNTLAYRLGFEPLVRGVLLHNIGSDLVAFFRGRSARGSFDRPTEAIIRRLTGELGR